MIDLYGMSSPNVVKVVICLEELNLSWRTNHVAVFKGEQFSPEMLAMSPFGKVPVIVDRSANDLTVFESGAILTYLAERYGEVLLPAAGPGRYAVLQWLTAQVAIVGPMLGQNNHFVFHPSEAGSYAAGRYAEQARRIYRVLEDRLAAAPWLAGDFYSIADIATYPWALYVPRHGLDWAEYPALKAWCDRIGARPALARAGAAVAAMGPADFASMDSATPADVDRFFGRVSPGPKADFSLMRG